MRYLFLAAVAVAGVALALVISGSSATCDQLCQDEAKIARADAVLHDSSLTWRKRVTQASMILEEPYVSPPTTTDTTTTAPTTTTPPPSSGLNVSGNQLLYNGSPVRLHGVNYSGAEYACIQGWGIFDGPDDDAMIAAIKGWNSNVVHLGLNEDCILGINGVPAAYAGANYMGAVKAYVDRLHAQGLYAEVSLMWAAPGTQKALNHPPILDQDHSPAALASIASTFQGDGMTLIGLQSEPHDITWQCWRDGGSACSVGYAALGMQDALNSVRAAGWTGPVTVSGIDYANNLSQWLAWAPVDALGQLIAEEHVYGGNTCSSAACFDSQVAPVAAQVPALWGETGEHYNDSCNSANTQTFMAWADAHNVGFEAWVWDTWGNCASLISDYNGTAYPSSYASYVRSHMLSLP